MIFKNPTLLLKQTETQGQYVGFIYTFQSKADFYSNGLCSIPTMAESMLFLLPSNAH